MRYYIELNEYQKVKIMNAALERIKDAPITPDEIQETCQDALHLVTWGTYHAALSEWGKTILRVVLK